MSPVCITSDSTRMGIWTDTVFTFKKIMRIKMASRSKVLDKVKALNTGQITVNKMVTGRKARKRVKGNISINTRTGTKGIG